MCHQTPALLPTDNAPVQYLRVTLNWATIAFFVFSFLHCFTQGTIQSFLFSADDSYGALTSEIVARANISSTIFPQYTGRHGKYSLELCDQVPVLGGEPHPCDPFFTVGQPGPVVIPSRALPSDFKNVSSVRQPVPRDLRFLLDVISFCAVLGPPRTESDERGGSQYKHRPHTLSSFSRPHLSGSSVAEIFPVAFRSIRSQGLMGSRTSSSLQPTEPCRSPSNPPVHSPSCIRRPSKCWPTCVHFSPFSD